MVSFPLLLHLSNERIVYGGMMAKSDRDKLHKVIDEASAGAGGMMAVRTVFLMLARLEQRFGDEFTIDGACAALDKLIEVAQLAKKELKEE